MIAKAKFDGLINLSHFFNTHPLSRHAPWKAWARFVSWQIRAYCHEELIVPWIGGRLLAVRRGMTGATGNIYVGLHEFSDMMLMLHFLRENDIFVDVGANVGSYTVLASGVVGARTWAFEPDAQNAQYLRRNIAINDLECHVTVHNCAVGAIRGEVPFTTGLDTMNRVSTDDSGNTRMVRQERLDAILVGIAPMMLKIDVEGYEEEVLRGASKVFENTCLKVVQLETVSTGSEQLLSSNGFERAYYDPFNRMLEREPVPLKSSNSLFVKDWHFVHQRVTQARAIEVLGHTI